MFGRRCSYRGTAHDTVIQHIVTQHNGSSVGKDTFHLPSCIYIFLSLPQYSN